MELLKLFSAIDAQHEDNRRTENSIENRTKRFLLLIGKAFCFEHSPYSLAADEVKELVNSKKFILETEKELKKIHKINELSYIFETKNQVDGNHPTRGNAGSYIIKVSDRFSDTIKQQIVAREAVADKKMQDYHNSKPYKLESALLSYCDRRISEKEASERAEISLIGFRSELSKLSRDKKRLKGFLGNRWREKAEALGILKATAGRDQLILDVADARMQGLSLCALAEKFKIPLGNISSILSHVRSKSERWSHERYLQEYGETWKSRSEIAFNRDHYFPGMLAEFLKDGKKTEKQFKEQSAIYEFADGYILS